MIVMGLNKKHCYHVSYVGLGSRFGSGTLEVDEKLTRENYKAITTAMKEEIEDTSDYRQVVILTFQELGQ